MAYEELLKNIEIFAEMSEEELAAVGKCVSEATVPAGKTVIAEDETGEALYLIREGKVHVLKSVGESEVQIAELEKGAAFGEMSLLDDFPSSATVRTAEDSVFLTIGRLDLNVLLSWDTVLAAKMWRSFARMLSGRLRDANDKIIGAFLTQSQDEAAMQATRRILAASQGSEADESKGNP